MGSSAAVMAMAVSASSALLFLHTGFNYHNSSVHNDLSDESYLCTLMPPVR